MPREVYCARIYTQLEILSNCCFFRKGGVEDQILWCCCLCTTSESTSGMGNHFAVLPTLYINPKSSMCTRIHTYCGLTNKRPCHIRTLSLASAHPTGVSHLEYSQLAQDQVCKQSTPVYHITYTTEHCMSTITYYSRALSAVQCEALGA